MWIIVLEASSMLLVFATLCSTGVALFIAWRLRRAQERDCALEQTRLVKAVKQKGEPRGLREFTMLATDTMTYLKSIRVLSKEEKPTQVPSLVSQGQFKKVLRTNQLYKF